MIDRKIGLNMITSTLAQEYYKALVEKNSHYEGVFFVGVKSTGIFCRPVCPAKKPKQENCEFFKTAKEAVYASYRPCKRCKPLSQVNASDIIDKLVAAVEENPEKRWKESDFENISAHSSTVRRHFQKRFGMSFVEYARARRLGIAMHEIRHGEPVIQAQLAAGYESGSGFRDAFSKTMGMTPSRADGSHILYAKWFDTLIGPMVAMADHEHLYLLEFVDRRGLETEIIKLRNNKKYAIVPGETKILTSIQDELDLYFKGELIDFKTPFKTFGTDFQRHVWGELLKIPFGETISYLQLAINVEKPKGYRAVANANGANQLAILIPCHRVINNDGRLGGYGGGIARKQWLIEHENRVRMHKNLA